MRHPVLSLVPLAVLVAAPGAAQQVSPGNRVFGLLGGTDTFLVDPTGTTLHTWTSTYSPGIAVYLDDDGTLLRSIRTTSSPIPGNGGGIQRLALDSTVLWEFRYDSGGVLAHHDTVILPNGNILMMAWEDKTPAEAIAAGRNPAILGTVLRPDHIIEVQPTGPASGTIVWEWHAWDHLIQDFDPTKANYGVVGQHPELIDLNYPSFTPLLGDWHHFNGIDYDAVHDHVVVSVNNFSEIWIIDHGTTTQEAAGHTGGRRGKGGDLLYRWGNPDAYRAGTPAERASEGQHSPKFVPNDYPGRGNLMLFMNTPTGLADSAVYELELPLDPTGAFVFGPGGRYGPSAPTWSYTAPGFHSKIISSVERLPNGNTLICSGTQGRIFEVTNDGVEVSSIIAPGSVFHAHYYERSLWSDSATYSAAAGGSVDLDLIGGTSRAGQSYFVLGSITGTTPGTRLGEVRIPLNVDSWTIHTLMFPNSPLLMRSSGTLDGVGRATASLFNLPPAVLPTALVGTSFHHAYVLLDATPRVVYASNPVTFTIAP